uniref:Uncharacterized protein n=1 Tax=Setaria digitata TaxID=48799 RepID=A0A915Q825_9BILA
MATSAKTVSSDHVNSSGTIQRLNEAIRTAQGIYGELEGETRKFAREKGQDDVARVKLTLCNNSKRLVQWSIRGAKDDIQALPKSSGLIKAFDTNECHLIWRRPSDYNSWHELPSLKMMLQVKLIATETGKVVGEANSKFRAVVDPDIICTADEAPVHKMVLHSEAPSVASKKKKKKTTTNPGIEVKKGSESSPDESQTTTYWLLVLLIWEQLLDQCLLLGIEEVRERKTEETAAVQPHSESKNKPSKEPISRSLLRFAVEKEQPNLARVKLLLCNNSNRQVQWMLNCDDNAIKIEPMRSGRIEMLETGEVNLIWQRSEDIAKWTDAPSPKMQLLIKLIAVETGEEVIDTFVKFKATIKPEAECTINDLPIHKMILQSKLISEQSENNENNSKLAIY